MPLVQAAVTDVLAGEEPLDLLRQAALTYRSYWQLLEGVQGLSPDSTTPGGAMAESIAALR